MTRLFTLVFVLLIAFHLPLRAQDRPQQVRTTDAGIVLDFQDADLRLVLAAIAEAGGLNISYGELPQRPITLRTNQPISRENLRGVLESLVQSNGLIMQEEAGFIRITVPPPPTTPAPSNGQPVQSSEIELFVYRLKHATATQLASTLQALFGGGGATAASPALSRGSLSQQLRSQQLPAGLPTNPERVEAAQINVLAGQVSGKIQIVPDELTNALLVRASAADWVVIQKAVEALDLRPLQVLVEVLIAEVRKSSLFDLGLSAEVPLQHEPRTGARIGGEVIGSTTGDVVLRILGLSRLDADIVVSAISSRSDVTILSRPVILAQNNQEARIMIGSERPFVQIFRSLPTDAAVRDQVVQYRDVGTQLTLRPTINIDGYVSMDLLQEVSTATTETQFGAPVISTREAETRLLVKDGHTAVIGGLIDRQRDHTRSGIPILKDIPLLGRLFSSSHDNSINTELFIFITPHIVATDEDTERIRQEIEKNTDTLRERLPKQRTIVPPDNGEASQKP